ncbi:unnamed protein product, partial [Rotaria sp. Silwood2]
MFRSSARAFANDPKADQQLSYLERIFIYIPLEHSENLDDQHRA